MTYIGQDEGIKRLMAAVVSLSLREVERLKKKPVDRVWWSNMGINLEDSKRFLSNPQNVEFLVYGKKLLIDFGEDAWKSHHKKRLCRPQRRAERFNVWYFQDTGSTGSPSSAVSPYKMNTPSAKRTSSPT